MDAGRCARGALTIAGLAAIAAALLALVLVAVPGAADAAADLTVATADIDPTVDRPTQGTSCVVNVTVHNDGDANATGFYVSLRDVTAAKDVGRAGPLDCAEDGTVVASLTWDLSGATAGDHTLKAVADPDGDVAEDDETNNEATRTVRVNAPPTAVAYSSAASAQTFDSITFDGIGSTDPEGSIAAYLWYFGDGNVQTGANVSHSYADGSPSPGRTYNVTLVVTDPDGGTDEASLTVRVINRAPTASAKGMTVNTVTLFTLSGDASSDRDGNIAAWSWTLLHNGTVLTGATVRLSYPDDGLFSVRLTVTDDDGATASITVTIVVNNQVPVVDIKANRTIVAKGDVIAFNGSASHDVDGAITSHTWIFGDGSTLEGVSVVHSYAGNGSYNVTLVAVDDDGALAHKTVKVIVGNSAPVAIARANRTSVLTFEEVELNATSSFDPDSNIAAYRWDFGDGASADGEVALHNWSDDGSYTVTLVVTDTAGAAGIGTTTVVVLNRPPTAAFTDLQILTNATAAFNGSMCDDPDGYIAEWRWDCGAGRVYTTADASTSWDRPGTYVVTLTVKDDDGATASTTFNVTVGNRPPMAVATATPAEVTRASPVSFDGSGSSDADGSVVNWSWSFGDGVLAHGARVGHTYASYGTYLVTLTVRDDGGAVNSTSVLVTVRNQAPTAVINATLASALTGVELSFDGSNSTDPENQISEHIWSFGDGGSATGAAVKHTFVDDGWYVVRLTVVDQDGASASTELLVTILNRPPSASASAQPAEALTADDITFGSEGTSDPDGRPLWYCWDLGDGMVAFGATVVHAYADSGVYTVTLTVTDDDGAEGTATVTVKALNRPPVVAALPDVATVTGALVRLDGRGATDPDGSVVEWRWDFGDGTTGLGPLGSHAYGRTGTYNVTLTVVDDDGATASTFAHVTVRNVAPVAKVTGALTVLSGEEVSLSGTQSHDLDGTITEFRWNLGDGTTSLGPTVRHAYARVGTYKVRLVVVDDGGLESSADVEVRVLNRAPHAKVTASPTILLTSDTVSFDGRTSTDPDGTIVDWTWIFGDGSLAHGSSVGHSYAADGVYMVVLTVLDDAGGADSTSVFVQVENRPPVPVASGPATSITLVAVGFSGANSTDPDGTVGRWFWDFGDGRTADGVTVSHAYDAPGEYTVRLTVMDDDSRTMTTTIGIDIANRPPAASATVVRSAYVNETVRFDCAASQDPDGLVSKWIWYFGDGSDGEGRETFHEYLTPGTYSWNLTVIDDRGATGTVSGTITVSPQPVIPGPDDGDGDGDGDGGGLLPGMGALATALALLTAVAVAAGAGARARARRD